MQVGKGGNCEQGYRLGANGPKQKLEEVNGPSNAGLRLERQLRALLVEIV